MPGKTLFVVGASGVGKTAALLHLQSQPDFNGTCYFFDDIGVPSADEIHELDQQGVSWQACATQEWVRRLASDTGGLSILEGQTAPAAIAAEARRNELDRWSMILLDCDPETRLRRLTGRGQPALASDRMNTWAAYLRGQADALSIAVVNTSSMSIDEVAAAIRAAAESI